MKQTIKSHEFQLIKIRSKSDAKVYTVKQSRQLTKRLSLSNLHQKDELNETKIRENFPHTYVKIHSILLLVICVLQIALQIVEININQDFVSGIYSSFVVSIYALINVIFLFVMGSFFVFILNSFLKQILNEFIML